MHNRVLSEIGAKIRKVRQRKHLTVQALANRAGVSKGLISRIENNRTIPSLPVLISIIKALEVEVNAFFEDIDQPVDEQSVIVRRQADWEEVVSEVTRGFRLHPIIGRCFSKVISHISVLEMEPGAQLEKQDADAYEFRYVLEGEVDYEVGDQKWTLKAGDCIYFDGHLPHIPINHSEELVRILAIHFLAAPD